MRLMALLTMLGAFGTVAVAASGDERPAATALAVVFVEQTGIQEVPWAELRAAAPGIVDGVDPDRVSVAMQGDPVPSQVVLDAEGEPAALRFWGESHWNFKALTRYAPNNAYMVVLDAPEPAQMTTVAAPPEGLSGEPEGYQAWNRMHMEAEKKGHRFYGSDELHPDYYFGDYFDSMNPERPAADPFHTQNLAEDHGGRGFFTIRLFGYTSLPVDPDHFVTFSINGEQFSETTFDGSRSHTFTASFDLGLLRTKTNILEVRAPGTLEEARRVSPGKRDQNGLAKVAIDSGYVDWFTVDYPLGPRANRGVYEQSRWTAEAAPTEFATRKEISGFLDDKIVAWDLAHLRDFPAAAVREQGEQFSATFDLIVEADSHFWMSGRDQLPKPAVRPAYRKDPSELAKDRRFVIIYHPEFEAAAHRLEEYRQSRGTPTLAMSCEALYDHYTFGLPHPDAFRRLIDEVRFGDESQTEAVLLFGGASYDTKSHIPRFAVNHLPSPHTEETGKPPRPADNLLVSSEVGRGGGPEFPLGRLPVRSLEEAHNVVDKIIAFENPQEGGDWKNRVLFATGEKNVFQQSSNKTLEHLLGVNPDLIISRIYPDFKDSEDYEKYAAQFTDAFNAGQAFVSFIGHGASTYWRFSIEERDVPFMTPEQILEFTNEGMPSIVYGGTCYTNKFDVEESSSICLRLLAKEDAGAVAVVSTSHRMSMTDALNFQDAFSRQLFDAENATIGKAYLDSFLAARLSSDALSTMSLLADPMMDIRGLRGRRKGHYPAGAGQ